MKTYAYICKVFEYIYSPMKEKQLRQQAIKDAVRNNKVTNQEELSSLLEQRGISVAQATLSRDIREMKISKVHDGDGYFYSLPGYSAPGLSSGRNLMESESIQSVEFSGNMCVVKTLPGHANMVGAVIDGMHLREVAGTLAGDDTLLMVLREGVSRDGLSTALSKVFKGIMDKTVD